MIAISAYGQLAESSPRPASSPPWSAAWSTPDSAFHRGGRHAVGADRPPAVGARDAGLARWVAIAGGHAGRAYLANRAHTPDRCELLEAVARQPARWPSRRDPQTEATMTVARRLETPTKGLVGYQHFAHAPRSPGHADRTRRAGDREQRIGRLRWLRAALEPHLIDASGGGAGNPPRSAPHASPSGPAPRWRVTRGVTTDAWIIRVCWLEPPADRKRADQQSHGQGAGGGKRREQPRSACRSRTSRSVGLVAGSMEQFGLTVHDRHQPGAQAVRRLHTLRHRGPASRQPAAGATSSRHDGAADRCSRKASSSDSSSAPRT